MFAGGGLLNKVIEAIPEDEYWSIKIGIDASINAVYAYRNSVMGILDTISNDYSGLSLEAAEI